MTSDTTNRNYTDAAQKKHRAVKSYVLRQGRLTPAQQNALQELWPDYGIDYQPGLLSFRDIFDNDNATVIEIGFGNGDSLLDQARRQTQFNFIGIEVHSPGVGHLIHNAHQHGVPNLRVIRHDAVDVLKQQIADASVSRFQLYFPDPWQKKRHHKRRILQPAFIALIRQKLLRGGHFHMATDWQHYAEQMLEQMDASDGFSNCSGDGNYSSSRWDRSETKFERRGIRLGHGVWDLIYEKS